MNGYVFGQQPCPGVTMLLQGRQIEIEFAVDTGFEGALTLPITVVATLNLPFYQRISANLADDSNCMVDVYTATILWHGQPLNVAVLAMGQRPLLGTSLLNGNDLHIRFEDGGPLTLDLLP